MRLGDIAEVRFGIKTGANDFFYLEPLGPVHVQVWYVRNGVGWEGEIEEEFPNRLSGVRESARAS